MIMASKLLFFALFSLFLYANCNPVVNRGAMSFVVSRGCPYLTHYVRDNYFGVFVYRKDVTSTTTPQTKINWATYVYDRSISNYIPVELIHGLINCGREYALYAVKPEQYVIDNLHPDFSQIPGVVN